MFQRVKKISASDNGVKTAGRESFSWFREYDLQRRQGMQGEPDGR